MAIENSKTDRLDELRTLLEKQPHVILDDHVEAAVAIILIQNETRQLEVLLIQRAERVGDPWSGHTSLPGGRIKSLDGSPKTAAAREALEEVGIDVRDAQFLGSLPPSYPWNKPELKVQPFVFGFATRPEVSIGPEVVTAFWVPLMDFPRHLTQSEVQTRVGPRKVESFLVEGHVVWGFTFRVLSDLLKLNGSDDSGGGH